MDYFQTHLYENTAMYQKINLEAALNAADVTYHKEDNSFKEFIDNKIENKNEQVDSKSSKSEVHFNESSEKLKNIFSEMYIHNQEFSNQVDEIVKDSGPFEVSEILNGISIKF